MKKFVWSSDFHLGLYTDEIDRTPESIRIMTDIVKHAVKIKADGVIFGGDIFNNNNPNSHLMKQILVPLNILKIAKIPLWIMPGNHDTIADKQKYSCLDFICRYSHSIIG